LADQRLQEQARGEQAQDVQDAAGETYLQALDKAVADVPDRIFLDFEGDRYSYADIDRLATRMANELAALGVGPGRTVVTLLDNGVDAVVCWFAVNRLGGVWVPVNTAYRREFLRHQLADSLAAIAVCEAEYFDRIAEIAGGVPELKLVLYRGTVAAGDRANCPVPARPLDEIRGADDTRIAAELRPEDLACLIYTSGTTGPSKGCMISHNYLCSSGRQQNSGVPPLPGEITWTCLPMFHVSTTAYVIVSTVIAQATASIARRFSVTHFWDEIERSGATTAMLMASMFPLLAQSPDTDAMRRCHGRLRAVTGVPVTAAMRQLWRERFGVPFMHSFGYGQTEASKLGHHVWGEKMPPESSAGRVCDDFELMIADENGRRVPPGVPGEILARPRRPNVMFSGYWRRPEETVRVWRDLWMHTGDIGKIDADGYLYFVDRKKDYLRSRGENISSMEVEAVFMSHAAVSEVALHAVRAAEGGEDHIKVTVVLREEARVTEEVLCRWSIENLPYFAVPRFFEFRASLPKTPTGRVQKYQLRDDGVTDATWDARAAGIEVRRR
jgi:crotonobetaine/carnitine-CoA ligase